MNTEITTRIYGLVKLPPEVVVYDAIFDGIIDSDPPLSLF